MKKSFWRGFLVGALPALLIGMGLMSYIWYSFIVVKINSASESSQKMQLIYDLISDNYLYDIDKDAMNEAIYGAMLDSLGDPYSVYYTAEEYTSLMQSTSGSYIGIGVVVTKDEETGYINVVEPYEGSGGAEAGILPEDKILKADGVDLTPLSLDEAVTYIKGEEGTKVKLTILRGEETLELEVERRAIEVITVAHTMLDGNIGYIDISQFTDTSVHQFMEAYEELVAEGMTGLIVDIRSNPGGTLSSVVNILDYLLPEGKLVYTENKKGEQRIFSSDADAVLDIPCAVLVNENSASASEIFAGALQDYGKAKIVGTQTFGKGIVQSIIPISDGTAVKITIENYFTPNGNNIHGVGITPDEVVEFDLEAYKENETDTQLNAAIEYINGVK